MAAAWQEACATWLGLPLPNVNGKLLGVTQLPLTE